MVSRSSSTISTKFESSIVLFQFSIGRTGHQSDTNSFYERADGIGLLICSPPNPLGPANCAPGESGDLAWCPAPKCRRRNSENRWEGWLSTHRAPASEAATRPPPGENAVQRQCRLQVIPNRFLDDDSRPLRVGCQAGIVQEGRD